MASSHAIADGIGEPVRNVCLQSIYLAAPEKTNILELILAKYTSGTLPMERLLKLFSGFAGRYRNGITSTLDAKARASVSRRNCYL